MPLSRLLLDGHEIADQVKHLAGPDAVPLDRFENAAQAQHHRQCERREQEYPHQFAKNIAVKRKGH
jgi:hypothetical protein